MGLSSRFPYFIYQGMPISFPSLHPSVTTLSISRLCQPLILCFPLFAEIYVFFLFSFQKVILVDLPLELRWIIVGVVVKP